MKYIDADKLIAEIERRIESWAIRGKNSPAGQGKDTCESRVTELSDLLSFITSLQQEQPEVDIDIQQELYHHFGQVKDFTLGVAIASYFYELGLKV